MIENIERLVSSYDRGALNRRKLLSALAVLIAAPAAADAQSPPALTKGRMLHHINVQVADVARSEAFYRRLLGLGPSRVVQGPDNHGLDLPGSGLIILQKSSQPGRIDHFCIGVDNFDADTMRTAVKAAGMEVLGAGRDNFSVPDPDGLRVQLSAVDWSA
jgi:catechol 2,3-dioxygenase-like lactoylglutathione lyase family enzyme